MLYIRYNSKNHLWLLIERQEYKHKNHHYNEIKVKENILGIYHYKNESVKALLDHSQIQEFEEL